MNNKLKRQAAVAAARKEKLKLDDDERAIEDSLSLGDWKSGGPDRVAGVREQIDSLKKSRRVNARFPAADIKALERMAKDEGLPGYQTLLGSIVHKYIKGELVNIKEVAKLFKLGALESVLKTGRREEKKSRNQIAYPLTHKTKALATKRK